MKAGDLEERYIVLITREVLIALAYLHKEGIIHRDIKGKKALRYICTQQHLEFRGVLVS